MELIGNLSEDETKLLNSYVVLINPDSEYYDRLERMDPAPNAIDNINYTFYCYFIKDSTEKLSFYILSYGDLTGIRHETYDENALAALSVVENSEVFDKWHEGHIK